MYAIVVNALRASQGERGNVKGGQTSGTFDGCIFEHSYSWR